MGTSSIGSVGDLMHHLLGGEDDDGLPPGQRDLSLGCVLSLVSHWGFLHFQGPFCRWWVEASAADAAERDAVLLRTVRSLEVVLVGVGVAYVLLLERIFRVSAHPVAGLLAGSVVRAFGRLPRDGADSIAQAAAVCVGCSATGGMSAGCWSPRRAACGRGCAASVDR
jgi:hypothetical protein